MDLRRYRWLGLGLFLLFTIAAALVAVGRVDHLARANEELRDHPFALADALLRAHEHANALHHAIGELVSAGDLMDASLALRGVNEHESALYAALSEVVRGNADEPVKLKPLFHALAEWRTSRDQVAELLIEGRWGDAAYMHGTTCNLDHRALLAALSVVLEGERRYAAHLREQAQAAERSAELAALVLAVVAGGALAAMALAAFMFVRTSQPLARLRGCMLQLAGGDTSIAIPYLAQDNAVGAIARAIDGFRRSMMERDAANAALRRSELNMRRAVTEARAANESKSRFLAAASHDLRQPLQAIRLYLDTLDTRLTDRLDRRILTGASTALAAGEELLRNYLDVSVLEAGILKPQLTEMPVAPLIEDLVRECAAEAEPKGLTVRLVPTDAVVRSDPALLRRVLRNLMANAVRYTGEGGVLIGCRRRGNVLRIEVWDTGIGIPADKLDAVFEDFYQLGNPERDRTRGLGLGLSVVDRAARLLGHEISVRSREGCGSVFAVTLPLAEAMAVEKRAA